MSKVSGGVASIWKNREIAATAVVLLACTLLFAGAQRPAQAASSDADSNVVVAFAYDDSSSMFDDGNTAWCQAKYSMETVAGMMGEDDKMRVFPLNAESFDVSGSDAQDRVDAVHSQQICAGIQNSWTPADSVLVAANWVVDQCEASNAKGYLIVAADGAFEVADNSPQEETIEQAVSICTAKGIDVIYLAIGDNAKSTIASGGVLNYAASTDSTSANSILHKMTEIGEKIFGWHELGSSNYSTSSGKLTLPTSSKRVIVVAQGEGASVGSLEGAKEATSNVCYSDIPDDEHSPTKGQIVQDTNLVGVVKIFTPSSGLALAAGDYDLSVSASGEVKVYYEPNVSLDVTMRSASGQEYPLSGGTTAEDALVPGTYTAKFSVKDNNDGSDVTSKLGLSNAQLDILSTEGTVLSSVGNGGQVTFESGAYTGKAQIYLDGDMPIERSYSEIVVYNTALAVTAERISSDSLSIEHADELQYRATVTQEGTKVFEGVVVSAVDDNAAFTWNVEGDATDGSFLLSPNRKEKYFDGVYHDIFGYDGKVTVTAKYEVGHNRGIASTPVSYHLNGDIVAALVRFFIPLFILLALIAWFLARGRLGKFHPSVPSGEFGKASFDAQKGSTKGNLIENKQRKTFLCRKMAMVGRPETSIINLSGVCWSFGRKARFDNWNDWKNAGWKLSKDAKIKGSKAIVRPESRLSTDGSNTIVKFSTSKTKGSKKKRGKKSKGRKK